MSSGQSLRNGSSVEPGLPNTLRMPNARNRSKVACLTVRGLFSDFGGKGFTPSFRGDAKHRARNLEIPGLVLTHHPGMTESYLQIDSYKSSHCGFSASISRTFHARFHFFSSFSREIAETGSS